LKRSGVGFDPIGPRGFLEDLSPAIAESIKFRDCEDAIASTRHACARQKTRSRNLSIPAALEELSTIFYQLNITAEGPEWDEVLLSARAWR
jgi:hypothetical protein